MRVPKMDYTSTELCQLCQKITIESLSASGGFQHASITALEKSTCPLCVIIRKFLFSLKYGNDEEQPIVLAVEKEVSHRRLGGVEAVLTLSNGSEMERTYISIVTKPGNFTIYSNLI